MVKIDFNEPSEGNVTDNNKSGLKVRNNGTSTGISGSSKNGDGVDGSSEASNKSGVWGDNTAGGTGVAGSSKDGLGVHGWSEASNNSGVVGDNTGGGIGVRGSNSAAGAGAIGVLGTSYNGIGICGRQGPAGGLAGRFEGSVEVTGGSVEVTGGIRLGGNVEVMGDILLVNADCAEDFDVIGSESIDAGTVMVLNEKGSLQPSYKEYDKKVAGIVAGAGGYKPAIVLDRQQSQYHDRLPVALIGKAYCKVDARHFPVEIGDLLTTSSTKGYAMKAADPMKAFGAVIGKALGSIKEGSGMIPVLVALQ